MKRKISILFFILGIIFAVLSMPFSGALTTGKLQRATTAQVVGDNNGALKLEGFQNKVYKVNNKYTQFGTITNNTMQIMKLTVVVCPEISWFNIISNFGIKIGTEEVEFYSIFSSPKQIVLTLQPGQTVNTSAALIKNGSSLRTSFQFIATNLDGSYSMQLTDSVNTPRSIICY